MESIIDGVHWSSLNRNMVLSKSVIGCVTTIHDPAICWTLIAGDSSLGQFSHSNRTSLSGNPMDFTVAPQSIACNWYHLSLPAPDIPFSLLFGNILDFLTVILKQARAPNPSQVNQLQHFSLLRTWTENIDIIA